MTNNQNAILHYRNTNVHSVVLACYFRVGSIYETKRNHGITHLVEHMFFRRLDDLTQQMLYRENMQIGGDMSGTTYCDYVRFRIKAAPQHLKTAIDLFARLFHDFHWTEDEVEKEKRVVKKQIAYNGEDESFYDWYFRGTKLGNRIAGTWETVDALTAKQVNEWKDSFFTRENACLVLTGNFEPSDYAYLCDEIEKIPQGCRNRIPTPECIPHDFGSRSIDNDVVIPMNGTVSDVCLCFDVDESKVDIGCAAILCECLGAGCGSRLSDLLRDKLALTDDVFCRIDTDAGVSRFTVEYAVDNRDLLVSLDKVMTEIALMKDITTAEWDRVREYFTTNQFMNLDDSEQLAEQLYWTALKHPQSHITPQEKAEHYGNITERQLQSMAKELFTSTNLSVFVYNNRRLCSKKKLMDCLERFRNLF